MSARKDSEILDETAKIEAEAAAWAGLTDRGLTAHQEEEFAQWLNADPRHATAYTSFSEAWTAFDALADFQEAEPAVSVPARSGRKWTWGLAAAAAVAIGLTFWVVRREPLSFAETVQTEVGGLQTLDLPDGSVVQLNTATEVEVAYTPLERRIRLRHGEAHFTVAKNPNRPFLVTAGQLTVRAVGTAFNIRIDPTKVEILVTDGKVRVGEVATDTNVTMPARSSLEKSGPNEPTFLTMGERFILTTPRTVSSVVPAPSVVHVASPDIDRALAWQSKRLIFTESTLAEAVAEFNRYNKHQLVIVDPRLADQLFGGTFEPGGYEVFVRLLEKSFGVTAETQGDRTLLRLKSP